MAKGKAVDYAKDIATAKSAKKPAGFTGADVGAGVDDDGYMQLIFVTPGQIHRLDPDQAVALAKWITDNYQP